MSIRSLPELIPQPTHYVDGVGYCPGHPLPFGASLVPGGINFSIYSRHATACSVVCFAPGEPDPYLEIPIPDEFRVGDVFCITVLGLDPDYLEYGFRLDGPWEPVQGHRFDPDAVLLDPYARIVSGREVWAEEPSRTHFPHRARVVTESFDWGFDHPLARPIEDLVIYELHVRGFTRHPSSNTQFPGTYHAIREKIPYLKHLGVNCIELMPIFEFDEWEHWRIDPATGDLLLNYWGYSPVSFFAPKEGYASGTQAGNAVNELKALIKDLHVNGIEVILDVVFNHTAEGNEKGPTFSFKGIDNQLYYILTPEGYYYNFSGTGNTFNCNHPRVRKLILDALRYWVAEYHVDGFRFDLASIMARDTNGLPLADPPILREMVDDPVLSRTKLIAEPWDADGLYHLGTFPGYGRWAEWNGKYRDTVRRFVKGDEDQIAPITEALLGSPPLYEGRGPIASINFVTAHDGFTLRDLFSYNDKHNDNNYEPYSNGTDQNFSWNCGVEGPTDDPAINALRDRMIRNTLALLLVSQGVPMLLMGDEMGRTQGGNNNAYCHDSEISWLDWSLLGPNGRLFDFVRKFIEFRYQHPVLRNGHFLRHDDYNETGMPDIVWHGRRLNKPLWTTKSRELAFFLNGEYAKGGLATDNHIYVAMNMHWQRRTFCLPELPNGQRWHLFADTGNADYPAHEPGYEPPLENQLAFRLQSRSVLVLVAR